MVKNEAPRPTALLPSEPIPRQLWIAALIVAVTCVIARIVSWPGFATHDTLYITVEAVRGIYTTYHPLLNGLLMRVLAVPFDSYAVYTSAQIVFCGYLFYRALVLIWSDSHGSWPAAVSAALWGASISTILYLGIIWKDVLGGYALLYLAALIFQLRGNAHPRISFQDAALLCVSLILVAGLRHGMMFNFLLVPLLIGWKKVAASARLSAPILTALAVVLLLGLVSRSDMVRDDEVHYTKLKIAAVAQPLLGVITNPAGYTSDDYSYDGALMFDVFGADFRTEYQSDYFKNKIVMTDEAELKRAYRAILLRTPRLCLLNVSLCLSGRVRMMLSTLQPSMRVGGAVFFDLGAMPDCRSTFAMNAFQCHVLDRFETGERPVLASSASSWLTKVAVKDRGAFQNVLVWNLIPALLLALGTLVMRRPGDRYWIVAGFFLVQMLLPFATAMATDYRYYYFLALYFFAFLPSIVYSCFVRKKTDGDGRHGQAIAI